MSKQKACRLCRTIHESEKCPKCGSKEFTEGFKGRIVVINPEKSKIAQELNIKEKGNFAVKTR